MPRKPMTGFRPFADEVSVQTFGDLSLENGTTRIALHGSLDLTRDQPGLDHARALKATLDAIVAALEAEDLPKKVVEETRAPTIVKNPFA
ncbi:hypothetical protein HCU64_16870 [Methylobacterium sp. C25]|uniref:hypothetical protein n=1 Tax=Methylobacterium sp. C25 TaxID=2721622 RepID=UPI001F4707AE|nr:hypothetical protein [Methylobacterium sp. C25]MCE4225430.1 hypothetical protein [Methylobacterium sp. C25]